MRNETLLIEGEDGKFVEGKKFLTYGQRRRYQTLQAPKRMQYKGEDEVYAEMDFTQENDPNLYLLEKLLQEWSKEENINMHSITNDFELGDLFDEFCEKVKEMNNLGKQNEEDGEKN